MKALLLTLGLLLGAAAPVWAACTTQSYSLPGGRYVFCTVCCTGSGSCSTVCH